MRRLPEIHYESGGHPFVARQLASLLYTHVTQTQATADGEALVLFSSAKRYLEEALAYSNVLKHYLPENIWAPLKKRNFDCSDGDSLRYSQPMKDQMDG